jgi:hypothetical protein
MKNPARGDSSTGSELKAVEEACREASRTVEPCELCTTIVETFRGPRKFSDPKGNRQLFARAKSSQSPSDFASFALQYLKICAACANFFVGYRHRC